MKFIPIAQPTIGAKEKRYIQNCLKSTWISSKGEFIDRFEQIFANTFGTKYAISTNNGTSALHLALLACNIGPNDEVLVPALTFVATANVVSYVGAKPVFVDIDRHTWNIDPKEIEKKITKKTKAIIPVHLYGYLAQMDKIMLLAKKYNLSVIEDAAQAHGATFKGKMVGSIGDIGCFSFYGNKIITTGEGGIIITNNKKLADKILLLKNHGMSAKKRYYHPIIGYNYRMTNLQAALGLAQLEQLSVFLKKRDNIEKLYKKLLGSIPGLVFQPVNKEIRSVCWLFSFLVTKNYGKTRSGLQKHLKNNNIDSRPFFYPLPKLPMYKAKDKFPLAEKIAKNGISLPTFSDLSKKQIYYIAKIINDFKKT